MAVKKMDTNQCSVTGKAELLASWLGSVRGKEL
jgi:hypothetical protein